MIRLRLRSCHARTAGALPAAVLLVLATAACSDSDVHTPSTKVDAAGDQTGGSLFDGGQIDGSNLNVLDGGDTTAETGPATCEFAPQPLPGQPGAPCASAADCDNNLCVNGPEGDICSVQCVDCCPNGYKCLQNLVGADTAFVCQPQLLALCYPCQADSECAALNDGALCLDYGDLGRYCGGACSADDDCPAGYACLDQQGTQGAGKQCVRQQGECGCSAKAKAAGAETVCANSNAQGSCSGTKVCGVDGFSPCSAQVPAAEACNALDDDCDGETDEGQGDTDGDGLADCTDDDIDGDGTVNPDDCDPYDAAVHPGAEEVCNGKDDDCDGQTDQGFADTDGDGTADCIDPDKDGDGVPDEKDCAPLDKAVSPKAPEVCNGKDDDCDGQIDEGFGDKDKDGLADCVDGDKDGDGTPDEADCAPEDATVYPGAEEKCNGKDDDCDGQIDEQEAKGCKLFYLDGDQDGFGTKAVQCLCAPAGKYTATEGGDCDDGDAQAAPGLAEVCANGKDDDCDGKADEPDGTKGCTSFWLDADGDGYGSGQALCLCGPMGNQSATKSGDCNDNDNLVLPGGTETCNGQDDDCDGKVDEPDAQGCTQFYADADQDGFGNANKKACLCQADGTYTTPTAGDCHDGSAKVNPAAQEACNGSDDDCDLAVDEQDALGCKAWYVDQDKDGFGGAASACLCAPKDGYTVQTTGDCNDLSAKTWPKAPESCDGADNDCDNAVDEGYALGGSCTAGAGACQSAGSYVCKADGSGVECGAKAGAGKVEACNGVDDDCNGSTDEGCDDDKDGYCDATLGYSGSPACPKGGNDCNDGNAAIKPGAAEVCDGVDNDCNGKVDGNTQPCSTACGGGTETCTSGKWGGCTAPAPKCTTGPCCDGCNFKPATTQCGSSAYAKTQDCSASTCGGDVILKEQWQYCTGSSSTCGTGNLKWLTKGTVQACASNQLCKDAGSTASCSTCALGCSGSACITQPTHTICVDPGWGGSEPGAVKGSTLEKNITLSIGLHLKNWLEADTAKSGGGGTWKVVMTRTSDSTVSLSQRAAICNNAGSERLLTIFTNDWTTTSPKGVETFHKTTATATAKDFAAKVQAQVVQHGGVYNRGVKAANYTILTSTSAAGAVTAVGFMSNPGDYAKIVSDAWRKEVAKGLLHAIQQSFGYGEYTP